MSNKLKEKYKKSLNFYNKGELDKALKVCEECMAESLKMPAVLNLKGLILYQKGQLDEAIAVWKINREVNDDSLSKTYIVDSKADEERILLYKEAEEKLNALEVSEALKLLLICSESDFNAIRVNTALGLCYLRKGEYPLCKTHVEKALEIDKNYKVAKDVLKELAIVYDDVHEKKQNKKMYGVVFLTALALGAGVVGFNKLNENKPESKPIVVDKSEKEDKTEKQSVVKPEKKQEVKKSFKSSELKLAIENKEGYEIERLISEVDKESLDKEDLKLYEKGNTYLKKDGAIEFYNNGQESYQDKKYENAKEDLIKSAKYGKGIYIYEHTLYYLGLAQIELKENNEAIKTFKEYEVEFIDGTYSEEVLYNLALLNDKEGNLDEAKKYARRLEKNFSESIYNNVNMDKIIAK